jgi:hypothetical protein
MVAWDRLQMGLGINARRCRAGKHTSRSVNVAVHLLPPPPTATAAFLMSPAPVRQAATACTGELEL